MRGSLLDYCRGIGSETLLKQWDHERNESVAPDNVSYGSNRKVWWRCEKGHYWQAQVKSRVNGCGCPVCANRVLIPGVNDLASTYPELARQWHGEKNGSLTAMDVFPGSDKKVWWKCEAGHEWQARISSRTTIGSGCPFCAGKQVISGVNDLASMYPVLAAQWHPTKNGDITPSDISPFSNRRVWWICEIGHEWRSVVAHRTSVNTGCPYCSGRQVLPGFNDLNTTHPQVAEQWHPTLNESLTPDMVTAGSHKRVWWQCDLGHVWKTVVYSRTGAQQSGCPVCAGKMKESPR